MTKHEDESEAALLALGSLTADQLNLARKRLRADPVFAASVRDWEIRLAPMMGTLHPVRPPNDLFERIERRIDRSEEAKVRGRTIRAKDGKWIQLAPGLRIKPLHQMIDIGRQTILLEVEPDVIYEGHDHALDEEIYVISGDLRIGDIELGPGDFHVAPKGSAHARATSKMGCRCLITLAL